MEVIIIPVIIPGFSSVTIDDYENLIKECNNLEKEIFE